MAVRYGSTERAELSTREMTGGAYLALRLAEAGAVKVRRIFDDRSNLRRFDEKLRKRGHLSASVTTHRKVFRQPSSVSRLVKPFRVEGPTKAQQAEVALEVRRDCRSSQVEPARTAMSARSLARGGACSSCCDGVRRMQQRLRLRDSGMVRHCTGSRQRERRKQLYNGCPRCWRAASVQVSMHRGCKRAQHFAVVLFGGCATALVL